MPLPHEVPFARLPFSVQTGTPVVQRFAPVRHGFVGVQVLPAVQAAHAPLLQTMFAPHTAPLTRFLFVSAHVMAGEQACVPAWHAFAGVHDIPAVHDTQLPELQTMFVPHEVPVALRVPSVQTSAPVAQAVMPL